MVGVGGAGAAVASGLKHADGRSDALSSARHGGAADFDEEERYD